MSLERLKPSSPTHEAEFASECLAHAGRTVFDQTKPLAVPDTQVALKGRWGKRSGQAGFVLPERMRSVGRQVVVVEAGRWFEQVAGGQPVVEEPVDGQRAVQIELGRFVGEMRSVESQFVEELVVEGLVEESAVGWRAVSERWTRSGRW